MKIILFIFLVLGTYACNNLEFVYDQEKNLSNPLYGKTSVAVLHRGLQNIGATYSEPRSLAEIPLRATPSPILAQVRHMIEPLVILKGEAALPATV